MEKQNHNFIYISFPQILVIFFFMDFKVIYAYYGKWETILTYIK